jgi:hypothetical protein
VGLWLYIPNTIVYKHTIILLNELEIVVPQLRYFSVVSVGRLGRFGFSRLMHGALVILLTANKITESIGAGAKRQMAVRRDHKNCITTTANDDSSGNYNSMFTELLI